MANKPFPFSVCKECCVSSGEAIDLTEIENEITKLNSEISAVQNDMGHKQNISNDLTVIPGNYGQTIILDGKTQYYYLECKNLEGEDDETIDTVRATFEVYCDNLEKDEHTFYTYIDISSIKLATLEIYFSNREEGIDVPIIWLDTPTIDYPNTKMLLAFQTTDGGASWIANQCYSLEVTE